MRENETYMNTTADSELHEEKKRLENVKTLRQPKLQAPVGEKDAHAKGWRRRDTQDCCVDSYDSEPSHILQHF